jgi:ADP-ribose pyrophosphatase
VTAESLSTGPLRDQHDPAEILESEKVFEGRVWDIKRETAALDGGAVTREFMSHSGAVAVLAIDDRDRVLVINQYRHPIRMRDWEVPAGLLDVDGEEPLEAAKRELGEEADLVAASWSEPIVFHPSPGGIDEKIHLFVARDLSASPHPHARTDEEAEIVIRWVTLDEVIAAALTGRIHNGTLMLAVLAEHARRG